MTGASGRLFARVEIVPHPEAGRAHLALWLGSDVVASPGRALALWIDDAVMNTPFPAIARDRTGSTLPEAWRPLRGDGSFTASARAAMGVLLDDGPPTVERLAAAAGTSVRTLQRRLGAENTTFSALLDDLRREEALRLLATKGPSVGEVAAMLGYAQQTSLTRAVRRRCGGDERAHATAPARRREHDIFGAPRRSAPRGSAQAARQRGPSVGEVAAMLGYAQQTSLTRAVRRWTDAPPRRQREREG
jgi:AraC-like DNA-binding protein